MSCLIPLICKSFSKTFRLIPKTSIGVNILSLGRYDSGGVHLGSSGCEPRVCLFPRNFRPGWGRRSVLAWADDDPIRGDSKISEHNSGLPPRATDASPFRGKLGGIHRSVFLIRLILIVTFLVTGSFLPLSAGAQEQSRNSIVDAAEKKDWDSVNALVKDATEEKVNAAQADGMTALHWAVFHQQDETVGELIDSKVNVDAKTAYDITPLSLAAETGTAKTVAALLAAGANPKSRRLGKETPLMLAARRGVPAIVKSIIDAGADVNAKEVRGQTALMWAAEAGNAKAAELLIEGGAKLDVSLKSGFTAFLFAARQGSTECARVLLDAGVDVNAVMQPKQTGGRHPRKGMSALFLAIESGHFELALELVERGADANDQRSGYGPLHAVTWVRKTKVGDDPAGDPAPRGSGAVTSLEFIRRMVELGSDVNLQLEKGKGGKAKLSQKGATPFLLAAATADVPMMKLLLELGADPMLNNVDDCTPLMAAAGVGVIAVGEEPGTEEEVAQAVKLLASLGVDVNAVDANGETAMHGAAYRNFPGAVGVLAELGSDPEIWNKKNKHGWTPRAIASGKRPGSFKPSPPTVAALDAAMKH